MGESPHPSKAGDDLDWAPATCRVTVWVLQDKNDSSTACREILAPFIYLPFSPALSVDEFKTWQVLLIRFEMKQPLLG